MANSLLTPSIISQEALRVLMNQLGFTKGINRQYDSSFAKNGAKIGNTLNIRKPNRFVVSKSQALVVQDVTESTVPLVLNQQAQVAFRFYSTDLTLTIDDFSERYIKPAVISIANQVDVDGMALANQVYQTVGTPGTTPSTLAVALAAGQKLDEAGCPMDDMRSLVLNPAAQAGMVGGLSTLFQSAPEIAKQYEKGRMGQAAGFTWKMDQNVQPHTVGPLGGTPVVNGASQTGSSLVTNGWTASAALRLNAGDVFTIAGVYSVNPQSYIANQSLQQFVVTANVSSDGSGNATIPISPAIVTSGSGQTVSGSPANTAAITVLGSANTVSPMNLAYHRDAFVLGCADLELPEGVHFAARAQDPEAGLSVRIVRQYDINTDSIPCRLDMLYGLAALYPQLACRIQG